MERKPGLLSERNPRLLRELGVVLVEVNVGVQTVEDSKEEDRRLVSLESQRGLKQNY